MSRDGPTSWPWSWRSPRSPRSACVWPKRPPPWPAERARQAVQLLLVGGLLATLALAPDTLCRQGDNRLEVFVTDDAGGRVRLRPLTAR